MLQEYLSKASSGEIAALVAAIGLAGVGIGAVINGLMNNSRAKEDRASQERMHTLSLESDERRQSQSLAVQLALEKWKADHAFAVKVRDAILSHDAKTGTTQSSYALEDVADLQSIDVTVRDMVRLTKALIEKPKDNKPA